MPPLVNVTVLKAVPPMLAYPNGPFVAVPLLPEVICSVDPAPSTVIFPVKVFAAPPTMNVPPPLIARPPTPLMTPGLWRNAPLAGLMLVVTPSVIGPAQLFWLELPELPDQLGVPLAKFNVQAALPAVIKFDMSSVPVPETAMVLAVALKEVTFCSDTIPLEMAIPLAPAVRFTEALLSARVAAPKPDILMLPVVKLIGPVMVELPVPLNVTLLAVPLTDARLNSVVPPSEGLLIRKLGLPVNVTAPKETPAIPLVTLPPPAMVRVCPAKAKEPKV